MWHWYTKIFYWWYQKSLFINHDIKWKSSKNLNNLFREYSRHNIDNDELILCKISIMNRLKPLTCMCMVCLMRIIKIGWNIFPKRIFSLLKRRAFQKRAIMLKWTNYSRFWVWSHLLEKKSKGFYCLKKCQLQVILFSWAVSDKWRKHPTDFRRENFRYIETTLQIGKWKIFAKY